MVELISIPNRTDLRRQKLEVITRALLQLCVLCSVARSVSASCSRFPKFFFKKVAQEKSKITFCNESCLKVAPKWKLCCSLPLFGLIQKYNNSKISLLTSFALCPLSTQVRYMVELISISGLNVDKSYLLNFTLEAITRAMSRARSYSHSFCIA